MQDSLALVAQPGPQRQNPVETRLAASLAAKTGASPVSTGNQVYASSANTLVRISLAATTGNFGISGISHFTLPALISSWAMRQGLRDPVSMTGGAPPCSCRARRAATRM